MMDRGKKTVVAFGEVLWDILPSCVALGGAPFNFAYRVNSLGDRGRMVSRLGRDDLGQQAFDRIAALGLDTALVQWDEKAPTGTVQVRFDDQNQPDYVIVPNVAYDRIALTDALVGAVEKADCVCFGTLAQRTEISAETLATLLEKATDALKLLDINLRKDCYDEPCVVFSLGNADVLKLNEDEAHTLGRMLGLRCRTVRGFCESVVEEWGVEYCLVTLGEYGAFGCAGDGRETYAPGYRVKLADSLGSGDAFSAGFVHQILRGASLKEAVAFGNILGAIVATQTGATTPIAPEEIERFQNTRMERNVHPEFQKS
ncbi:MAG: carbohydrate kinase [Planctomycetes bacterium]|nr:carbohydrate kinase [Planctomycetota bacterium]